jgi:hypothetical protein
MSFTKEGNKHNLKEIKDSSHEIIISHHLERLFKKDHIGIISQFNVIQVLDITHRIFTLICS